MITAKIVSPLEKCFLDQTPNSFKALKGFSMYKNEQASVQILVYDDAEYFGSDWPCRWLNVEVDEPFNECIHLRSVESVPNYMPAYETPKKLAELDPQFLRFTPGLYPDVLVDGAHGGKFPLINQQLHPIWLDFKPNLSIKDGEYKINIRIKCDDKILAELPLKITVLPLNLPEQQTKVTNWLYADCLADYYEVEPFSDKHFNICENFIKTAVENGINMIMMPVLTPPLDTAVGGERTTTQLVKITVNNGQYSFDFTNVLRWLQICKRAGVKYIEVNHLFTQWGAYHAPKVMATVDGEYKKIFGWQTDAAGEDYIAFLRQMLKELTSVLEQNWPKENIYFHLSDEPTEEHLEQYKKNKKNVEDILKGFKIIDALSHIEFYKAGICEIPIPCANVINDFLKEDIKERWVYYCCFPTHKYSNRFLATSLPRLESIGMQMYKYKIDGFLQWGYNFYNNRFSDDFINPYTNMTAGYWGIGGDAAIVYPGRFGKPVESIRLLAFKRAMDDIRVLKLCEKYYSHQVVVNEIEKITGTIEFSHCVEDSSIMHKVRERLNELILNAQK